MKKTRILCAGTFDRLHTGHIEYLKSAKALAENSELIVIVARDETSANIKKKRTLNAEKIRFERLKALNIADEVVLGYEQSKIIDRIISLKPDIIALGYDQWAKEEWLSENLKGVKIIRMPQFEKKFI